jgi:UDP-2,3-diacylglucosamine pyrophosphatase LpxH
MYLILKLLVTFLALACQTLYASPHQNTDPNFLVLTDIHLNQKSTHTMEISPTAPNPNNDLDATTFLKLVTHIKANIQAGTIATPSFIVLLGDMVGHARATSAEVFANESAVFSTLKNTFPQTPILYNFGNNDSFESDYGPFYDKNTSIPSPYEAAIKSKWKDGFLSTGTLCDAHPQQFPCLITKDTNQGYYTAYLQPHLKLISLNSILFSPKRVDVTELDAQQELQWLKDQLQAAKNNQDSVLIASHIPFGNNIFDHSAFWIADDQNAFLKLLLLYHDNIIGVLCGHTHMEELKVVQSESSPIASAELFTPGLSTSHGNAPSFKTFALQQKDSRWTLSDYDTFHFVETAGVGLSLDKLYRYSQYYCQGAQEGILPCLKQVSADKIKSYYTAGNPHFAGAFSHPEDIFVKA